jgi:hypothetical protein
MTAREINQIFAFYLIKQRNKYIAKIMINNKFIVLGAYSTTEEANSICQIASKFIQYYIDPEQFRVLCINTLNFCNNSSKELL